MTIVQPHKSRFDKLSLIITALILILLGAGIGLMLIYNQLVNVRHDILRVETDWHKTELANAELKNEFYKITDPKNIESIAAERSLILDKNPSYFTNQPLAANN